MENRFLAYERLMQQRVAACQGTLAPRRPATVSRSYSRAHSALARSMAADQRALVILIENGGIDLGIPELVDQILSVIPSGMLPENIRQQLITYVRDTVKKLTDTLLESADLALNHYGKASPSLFDSVVVLRNGTATYDDLRNKLFSLTKAKKLIDLFILTHGGEKVIAANGDITDAKIKQMRADLGQPLSIRSVYMMNCAGASLNQAWLDTGAKVSAGSIRNNYLPEPTNCFFWQNWQEGQNFETAVTSAYRKTINFMNEGVRSFIKRLPLPGAELIAGMVDFENMDFVRDSAPVISGQRSVTIQSDDLVFSQSLSSALATTVLPMSVLRSLSRAAFTSTSGPRLSLSASYVSPSRMMARREDYSLMQNPAAAAPLIAGIAVSDAVQIGLGAVAVVQSQVNASSGSFVLTYDKAQRLLTPEARNKMPGAPASKTTFTRKLMFIGSDSIGIDLARANIIIQWEGNPYGEIGTPVIRKELKTSTEWSKSSATMAITRLDRIPVPGADPRAWPIVFSYEGNYDVFGNGLFEFSGEFEINAFGGLKFNRHEVISRSLLDFAIAGKAEDYVAKGPDVIVATPVIPLEQVEYLKSTLPQ
jgi:hypothetical protein